MISQWMMSVEVVICVSCVAEGQILGRLSPKKRQDEDGNDAEKTEWSAGDEYMN